MTVEDLLAPYQHVEVTEADRKRAKDCVFVPIEKVIAAHRIATEQALADRAGHLVVAYHMAICSPKGVVPNDEFYDPAMAAELERRLGDAIRAGSTGD